MKIAILLATYMGEKYIAEQLDSILGQSYEDWKIYVHDDGSRDRTLEIIEEYREKNPDKIEIIDAPSTRGARNNFLFLMSQVEAPFYMCCDQDDFWLPTKIEKTVEAMERLEEEGADKPHLVFTDLTVVDSNLKVMAERMSKYQNLDCKNTKLSRILMQNVVTGCTMMMNRKLRDMAIQYKDRENIIMHDWWAGIIAANFGAMYFVDEPTILYRQHGDNSVGALDIKSFPYVMKKLEDPHAMRTSVSKAQKQAQELVDTFGLAADSLPGKFASAADMSKLERLKLYKENDFKKTGLARNIGLKIWG